MFDEIFKKRSADTHTFDYSRHLDVENKLPPPECCYKVHESYAKGNR